MERHKCKICSRSFSNGRALGGHMRSHLATLPLPPKIQLTDQLGGDSASSLSSFSSSGEELEEREREEDKLGFVYGLRDNPKRSFRLVDPEFLDGSFVIVQDRESETEPTRNPTRRRSKRTLKIDHQEVIKKPNLTKPSSTESMAELEPVLSSVSDASPEEDVALCLMMLSRDSRSSDDSAELRPSQTQGKYQCDTCYKVFKSFQALGGHQTSHKKIKNNRFEEEDQPKKFVGDSSKIYECPFCDRVFGSGQALGGHKRSHLLGSSSTMVASSSAKIGDSLVNITSCSKFGDHCLIDLNLPAPMEDDDFIPLEISAVSDY